MKEICSKLLTIASGLWIAINDLRRPLIAEQGLDILRGKNLDINFG